MTELTIDSEELIHFALHASSKGDIEKSIYYLKKLLSEEPDNYQALYILSTQYLELGMEERAIEKLKKSISLEPEFYLASFQLGFIYFMNMDLEVAIEHWEKLNLLGDENSFKLFKDGLVAFARDELSLASTLIKKGIDNNRDFEELNDNMNKLLLHISNLNDDISENDLQNDDKLMEVKSSESPIEESNEFEKSVVNSVYGIN